METESTTRKEPTMNHQEAIAFGISSARTGVDQINDPTFTDAVASYRENVTDTLNDSNASEHVAAALEAFDAEVVRLKGATKLPGRMLNKAQAEAVYAAMYALNNVGGKIDVEMQPGPEQFCNVEVRENNVGEVIVSGFGCEIHADQAAFATAYGLGA